MKTNSEKRYNAFDSINDMNMKKLMNIAKKMKVKGRSRMNKAKLVNHLLFHVKYDEIKQFFEIPPLKLKNEVETKPYVCYHCKETMMNSDELKESDLLIDLIDKSSLNDLYHSYFEFCEGKDNEFHEGTPNVCKGCIREILNEITDCEEETMRLMILIAENKDIGFLFSSEERFNLLVYAKNHYDFIELPLSIKSNVKLYKKMVIEWEKIE